MEDLGHFLRGRRSFLLRHFPAFLPEIQLTGIRTKVHANDVTIAHLLGRDQVGYRLNNQTFNSALQMSRAVSRIGALLKQISFAAVEHAQLEGAAWRRVVEPLLDCG